MSSPYDNMPYDTMLATAKWLRNHKKIVPKILHDRILAINNKIGADRLKKRDDLLTGLDKIQNDLKPIGAQLDKMSDDLNGDVDTRPATSTRGEPVSTETARQKPALHPTPAYPQARQPSAVGTAQPRPQGHQPGSTAKQGIDTAGNNRSTAQAGAPQTGEPEDPKAAEIRAMRQQINEASRAKKSDPQNQTDGTAASNRAQNAKLSGPNFLGYKEEAPKTKTATKADFTFRDLTHFDGKLLAKFLAFEGEVRRDPYKPEIQELVSYLTTTFIRVLNTYDKSINGAWEAITDLGMGDISELNIADKLMKDARASVKSGEFGLASSLFNQGNIQLNDALQSIKIATQDKVAYSENTIKFLRDTQKGCDAMLTILSGGMEFCALKIAAALVPAAELLAEKLSGEQILGKSEITFSEIGGKAICDLVFVCLGGYTDKFAFSGLKGGALNKALSMHPPETQQYVMKMLIGGSSSLLKPFVAKAAEKAATVVNGETYKPMDGATVIFQSALEDFAEDNAGGTAMALVTALAARK